MVEITSEMVDDAARKLLADRWDDLTGHERYSFKDGIVLPTLLALQELGWIPPVLEKEETDGQGPS